VRREGWQRFIIPAGSRYQSPGEMHVEADASSASYFVGLGALALHSARTDQGMRVEGVGGDIDPGVTSGSSMRPSLMGAQRRRPAPTGLQVSRGAWPLEAPSTSTATTSPTPP
jgi:3-phosphoshikimate 1-carboxyvinyltransferase